MTLQIVMKAPWAALGSGILAVGLSAASPAAPAAAVPARPNVVFILADDLGWGDVGFNGGSIPTPNLDRLARGGVVLSQHYVAPVCTPSRAGLLTGRYWTRFGVLGVQAIRSLPFVTITLPRALKSVGYDTALVGKWHLGSRPEWGPNHFGFDYSYGSLGGGVGPWDHSYKTGPYMRTWHRNNELIAEKGHVTDLLGDEDVKWISTRTTAPFFLYAAFTAPHIPIKEPQAWLDRVPAGVVRALERRFAAPGPFPHFYAAPDAVATDELTRHYAACIMHLDYEVGRIVAALEKAGKRETTLIVFTSDNGSPTGVENDDPDYPPDGYPKGPIPGSNYPWRGFKAQLYEGGIHVAALANWPGVIEAGRVRQPVGIIDWMPTFCALAGYVPDRDLEWDGIDIWPFLADAATPVVPRILYTGFLTGSALRDGDWKLIASTAKFVRAGNHPGPTRDEDWKLLPLEAKGGAAGKEELYDLLRDPGETTDLAGPKTQAEIRMLEAVLATAAKADRDAAVPPAEREKMLKDSRPNSSGEAEPASWLRQQFRDE